MHALNKWKFRAKFRKGFEPFKWVVYGDIPLLTHRRNFDRQARIEMWLSLEEIKQQVSKQLGLSVVQIKNEIKEKISQYIV